MRIYQKTELKIVREEDCKLSFRFDAAGNLAIDLQVDVKDAAGSNVGSILESRNASEILSAEEVTALTAKLVSIGRNFIDGQYTVIEE